MSVGNVAYVGGCRLDTAGINSPRLSDILETWMSERQKNRQFHFQIVR